MTSRQAFGALAYGVRVRVVAKYLGQLVVVLAAVALVPAVVAAALGEVAIAWRFAAIAALLAATGGPLARLGVPPTVQPNEALTAAGLAYVVGALALAFPLTGAGLSFGTALFESISGLTTTGLSLVAEVDLLPRSVLFARAWLQWCGGLGIVVFSVVILTGTDIAARRLMDPAPVGQTLATTTLEFARRMLKAYLVLTGVAVAALLLAGIGGFDAVAYAFAAVSTGGFAPRTDSLAALDTRTAQVVVTLVGLSGAVALPLYAAVGRGDWRRVVSDVELQALLVLTTGVCVALVLLAPREASSLDRVLLGISAQTTTGFSSVPPAGLDAGSKSILLIAMAIGGAVGSTAGGVKLLRVLVLVESLRLALRRMATPARAVVLLRLQGRRVSDEDAVRALLLILVFVITAIVSWIPFVAAGYDPLDSLFEVVSALGTVGLGTGVTSEALPAPLRWVLGVDMLLGRVEFLALLVVLYPPTWLSRRATIR